MDYASLQRELATLLRLPLGTTVDINECTVAFGDGHEVKRFRLRLDGSGRLYADFDFDERSLHRAIATSAICGYRRVDGCSSLFDAPDLVKWLKSTDRRSRCAAASRQDKRFLRVLQPAPIIRQRLSLLAGQRYVAADETCRQ